MAPDNVDLSRAPVHAGKLKWKTFLVSFMVDARGGAMRGCRHSGVRVIIPPRRAPMPMRITCRYLRKEKLAYPPPLMEGEACASRILEVGPSGAKFLGPVVIEVPHFASLRGREREITILRSDNGETWHEHTLEASEDAVHDVFNESFEGEELTAREHLSTDRITRILTTDFPQYFAIITRIRQEVHVIGPEGGMVSSTVVPQVQVIFPEGALTKKIKVGLQAQPITPELVTKLLGNRVAVSPILTVEPRRRKFHKPITLTIPVPQAATKGMINQYSGDAPTLRLLCSITGGTTKAQWEDVTGSTPLTFVNDCVSFTTTVSARFWLIDCRQVNEATKFATELYREAIHVPFMAKFVVFAKRHDPLEAQLRVFCMTDDKEDKTLESQEHFTEVAKSRDVEVLEGKLQYLEFAGNLVPVTKSGEQLSLTFQAFRENRLPFTIRVKDPHQEPMGRVAFMREARVGRGDIPQSPICNLNIVLPEADLTPVSEMVTLEKKYGFVKETSLAKPELIHRADLRLSDIAKELRDDWVLLALQLDVSEADINTIRSDHPHDTTQQAHAMLRHWLHTGGHRATGNFLEKGLRKINREDIVNNCMFNVELVTDDVEKAVAKVHLDQSGFDTFKEELGPSRDASLRRDISLNGTYDEQDIMKDAESAAESSSESSDRGDRHAERKGKVVTETVIRTSAKVFEETPETLVQGVPSALSEAYSHTINGQMSDASIHDEDQSEPTVATLSSEATAEMEVSSLDDKSQGESHVEKKAKLRYTGSEKVYYKRPATSNSTSKLNTKEIPRYIKHQKQKRNVNLNSDKRKTISDFNTRAMTPLGTSKRQKSIARRNSWPPVSPLKLTRRKKYHDVIKVKDFQEPFVMDSYEWLTMKSAPEKFKLVPLAQLSEFEDDELVASLSNFKTKVNRNSMYCAKERPKIPPSNRSKLSFYFVFNPKMKHAVETKKYLQNLKNKFCVNAIPSLKPTAFDYLQSNETPSSQSDMSFNMGIVQNVPITKKQTNVTMDVRENFPPSRISYYDINVDNIESSFEDIPSYVSTPSPLRPLSYNSHESYGDVLICNPISISDNYSVKQKIIVKEYPKDKENIKYITGGLPNSKFSDHLDKGKKNVFVQPIKRTQKTHGNNEIGKYRQSVPNFNKMFEKEFRGIPKQTPNKTNKQDITSCAQDMMDPNAPNSKKSNNPADKSTSSSSSAPASKSTGSGVAEQSSQSSSNSGKNNKPSARQLFEQDMQSNFSMSSMATKDKSDTESKDPEEKTKASDKSKTLEDKGEKKKEIPASVLGQAFLSTLIQESQTQSSEASIPAAVIGQSFLKTLQEQSSLAKVQGKAIPAEVIGQSFIKNLLSNPTISETQVDKPAEADKSASSKQSSENVLPASVLGQTFLKSLMGSIPSSDSQGISSAEKPIPSNVLSQEFLKTLLQDSSKAETQPESQKAIPAPVVGQTFLKSLLESQIAEASQSKTEPSIPSSVLAQSFLKSLISTDTQIAADVTSNTAGQEGKLDANQTSSIPSTVLAQTFLKSLITEPQADCSSSVQKSSIPSSVLAQTFMKSLISESASNQENKTESDKSSSVPSSVLAQTFLKSLITETETTASCGPEKANSGQTSSIPSSVLAQTFLKSLVSDSQAADSSVQEKADSSQTSSIPSSVLAQTFLKSLVSDPQAIGSQEKADNSQTSSIPSSVLAQTFLKSLVSDPQAIGSSTVQEKEANNSQTSSIPSSVLAQTFLKSLVSQPQAAANVHEKESDSGQSTSIPPTVLAQTFLKSLMTESQAMPSSTVQEKETDSSKTDFIPSNVLAQTFLKSLLVPQETSETTTATDQNKPCLKSDTSATNVLPASVLGQSFLKSLIQEQEIQEAASKSFDKPLTSESATAASIPSNVVGQAFLKSLLQETAITQTEKSNEAAVPSSVVTQTFLKSLLGQASAIEETPKEPTVPSAAVSQAFLRSLLAESSIASPNAGDKASSDLSEEKLSKSDAKSIPASVVGQAFLSSLLSQASEPVVAAEKDVIPASVVGLAFLKSLNDQAGPTSESAPSESEEKRSDKSIPANVVGQAFLKTLFSMSGQTSSPSSTQTMEDEPYPATSTDIEKSDLSGTNGCSNGCFVSNESSSISDEQIIPPPPEFSGASEDISNPTASTSSLLGAGTLKAELSSNIIEELLSCTKVMQSVIESMQETDSHRSNPDIHPSGSDVCKKD